MQTLIINRPDDWHVHFRNGLFLQHTVPATAQHFGRALVMPNLKPALTTVESLLSYRQEIQTLITHQSFIPYMTLYINETVSPSELETIKKHNFILGAKLYPAGATTNSDEGTRSLTALYPLLEIMQEQDLVLQIHGEVTHGDIFQREAEFIETCLAPLIKAFPKLRIVLEHISTKAAVDFVSATPPRIAATITPHHILYNRNQLLAGGIRPHYYCLPILKKESDQRAIQQAAISGNPKFFAGTDSAPHSQANKENECGCAGIYSAPFALAMYTEFFDKTNKLPMLNSFLGHFGADFYHLLPSKEEIILRKQSQLIPASLPFGQEKVIPIAAGETLAWSINEPA